MPKLVSMERISLKGSKDVNEKTSYKDSSYPIARMFVKDYQNSNKPYWTKEDINKATEQASERILNFIFS